VPGVWAVELAGLPFANVQLYPVEVGIVPPQLKIVAVGVAVASAHISAKAFMLICGFVLAVTIFAGVENEPHLLVSVSTILYIPSLLNLITGAGITDESFPVVNK